MRQIIIEWDENKLRNSTMAHDISVYLNRLGKVTRKTDFSAGIIRITLDPDIVPWPKQVKDSSPIG
jgi:hypothetical protein